METGVLDIQTPVMITPLILHNLILCPELNLIKNKTPDHRLDIVERPV